MIVFEKIRFLGSAKRKTSKHTIRFGHFEALPLE